MDYRIKAAVITALVVPAVISVYVQTREVVEAEKKKREQFRLDSELDIQAIHNAADATHERIVNGKILSLTQLASDLQNEIAFQKIAIREQ